MTDKTYAQIMELEDSLQSAGVFCNPFTGRTCHSDSYGTTVEPVALRGWIKARTEPRELLDAAIDYWLKNGNMQPPLRFVALILRRALKGETV